MNIMTNFSSKINELNEELLKNKSKIYPEIYQYFKKNYEEKFPIISELDKKLEDFTLTPLLIDKKIYLELYKNCELILSAIEKIIQHYRINQELQDYFREFNAIKDLILVNSRIEKDIFFTRFDIAINKNGQFYLLEINNSYPLISEVFFDKTLYNQTPIIKNFLNSFEIQSQNFDDEYYLIKEIANIYSQVNKSNLKNIVCCRNATIDYFVKEKTDDSDREIKTDFIYNFAQHLGYKSTIVYEKDLIITNDNKCYVKGSLEKIDVIVYEIISCRLKNTFSKDYIFNDLLSWFKNYKNLAKSNNLLTLGSYASASVGESKKLLALLYSKKYHYLFNNQEKEAIESLIIPTYDLKDYNEAIDKNNYVLKHASSFQSKGVFIGKEMDQAAWQEIVSITKEKNIPAVLQKYIDSKTEELVISNKDGVDDYRSYLGVALINGQASGVYAVSMKEKKPSEEDSFLRHVYVVKE